MHKLIYLFCFAFLVTSCKDNKAKHPKIYEISLNNQVSHKKSNDYISEVLFITNESNKKTYKSDFRLFFHLGTEVKSIDEFYFLFDGNKYELEYIDEIQRSGDDIELLFKKEEERKYFLHLDTNIQELLAEYGRLINDITFWYKKEKKEYQIPFTEKSKVILEVYK